MFSSGHVNIVDERCLAKKIRFELREAEASDISENSLVASQKNVETQDA